MPINKKFLINEDFNQIAFEKFLIETKIDKTLSKEHILKNLDLMDDEKIRNAGVLFFAKLIRRFFLNAVITAVM